MKKLFVPSHPMEYQEELLEAYKRSPETKMIGNSNDLNTKYILDNNIDVVICNELSPDQYNLLKGLEVPIISIGSVQKLKSFSDIVIDYKASDDKRYFTGTAGKIVSNFDLRIDKIVNLIEKLDWDSNFFGFNVGYLTCMHLTENIMKRVNTFIKKENIRLVEYLCNCHNAESVKLAEDFGFNFVDVRLVFRKQINKIVYSTSNSPDSIKIKIATIDDLKDLIPIARESYVDSRYFFDKHFPDERCQQFYEDWLKKSIVGEFDDLVFAAFDKEKAIGFISVKKQDQTTGKIGLVGVHENYQGKGIGKMLINQVFQWTQDNHLQQLDVVTQGRNYSAQRLYQKMGFTTKLVQLWYHKWIY
jgi:dTDP-4-amino-4,6-dideoxy-D-galactose acyltransferase